MNAITKALSELSFTIPPEILGMGFMDKSNMVNTSFSLEEIIMTKVIRPRVLVDTNIVGGIHAIIPLDKCDINMLKLNEYIVRVPKEITNNKSIMTVLSLVAYNMNSVYSNIYDGSDMVNVGINLANNLGTSTSITTARLELIADNTILIDDPSVPLYSGTIRCMLENSVNLSNINPRNYLAFARLVELAVKAYIYNSLIVKLDKGFIWGGHELGVIKEIVDGYADANTMYNEYLTTTWKKIAYMNNSDAVNRLVKSMISNTI